MAKWRVPVEWTMCAVAEIEAPTLELAIDAANHLEDFPDNEETYVDDSYGVSEWQTEDEIRELYNDNQQDEAEESFFKFKRGNHVLYKGESQTVVGLCVREDTPAYELRPVDVGGHTYWFPIAEDELCRADNISGAGIQELFD